MSYSLLVTFVRKCARLLYKDELTPVIIDYLIEKKMVEDYSLAFLFKLEDKEVRIVLERLERHGLLKKKNVTRA